jgi:hypothetical protein
MDPMKPGLVMSLDGLNVKGERREAERELIGWRHAKVVKDSRGRICVKQRGARVVCGFRTTAGARRRIRAEIAEAERSLKRR